MSFSIPGYPGYIIPETATPIINAASYVWTPEKKDDDDDVAASFDSLEAAIEWLRKQDERTD